MTDQEKRDRITHLHSEMLKIMTEVTRLLQADKRAPRTVEYKALKAAYHSKLAELRNLRAKTGK